MARTTKYTVAEGCGIFTSAGGKSVAGDVVELEAKEAKHFMKSLRPFIEDEDLSEVEVEDVVDG
jgi:hypothetical protein